jgi:hypothetical protein
MRRARGIFAAALAAFLAVTPSRASACPIRLPEVLALGGGQAWVRYGRGVAVFSLRDGALRKTLETDLAIMDVHFDPRRGEFWGTAWGEPPFLWTWSETAGFQRTAMRARLLYASYQAETGDRLIAATLSTAASFEEVAGAFVALGVWKNGKVRFVRRAPPPSSFQSRQVRVGGDTALFGYLVHTARAEAVLPPSGFPDACYVRLPQSDLWLIGDRATLRLTRGPETGEWIAAGEIPAPRAGLQFRLAGLFADPYRAGHIHALLDVDGLDGRRILVCRSRDEGRSWERVFAEPSTAIFPLVFDDEGVWIQTHAQSVAGEWDIALTLVLPNGARGRTIRLALPE